MKQELRIANCELRIARPNSYFLSPISYLLLALLAAAFLWGPGMVNTRGGGDSPFLLQRTLDMADSLRHGVFPPRWMAHAAYDLGYPMFNHYAALPYYLSGGLTALGIGPLVAIQATQTLGFALAALTMALWAGRVYQSRMAALLAVAAYTFAPFHLVNVYVRGDSLSEFYAFVWYPLILWALDRLAERPTAGRTVAAALPYAALILTHNVSALIFSPFALLYGIVRMANGEWRRANGEGRIANSEWRMAKGEGRMAKGEGRRAKGEGRSGGAAERRVSSAPLLPLSPSPPLPLPPSPRLLSTVYRLLSAFLLAFLLTAWFWAPAILETKYGQMGAEFTAGYFHYSQHFRGWNLVQPSLAFDYNVAIRTEDAGPFAMGLVQAGAAALGVIVLVWRLVESRRSKVESQKLEVRSRKSKAESQKSEVESRRSKVESQKLEVRSRKSKAESQKLEVESNTQYAIRNTQYFLFFGLFLSTFMITPLSKPLWDYLPLLEMTQFPWRFLSIQALFTAMVTGAIANGEWRMANYVSRFTHYSLLITHYALLLLIIISTLFALRPERLLIDDADVTWEKLLFYETFTGNIGTTIRYEYLPRDVNPRLYISESVIDGQGCAIADGDARLEATVQQRAPQRQVWQATLDKAAPVTFPLNWWPGWQAEVDGARAETSAMPGSGRLTVALPAGTHTVVLRLGNTRLRTAANGLSIFAIVGLIAYCVLRNVRLGDFRLGDLPFAIRYSLFAIRYSLFALGIFALCLLLPLGLHRKSPGDATFFDFNHSPYPHAGPVALGAARLEAATLSAEVAQPGEVVTVTHRWADVGTPVTGTVRLVSPAEARHGVAVTLGETSFIVEGEGAGTAPLRMPDDLARGLYWVEMRVNGGAAVYVGAVRVPHGPARRVDAPVLAEFRDVTLHAAETMQPDATTLRVKLAWSTAGTPRNWSLSLRVLDAAGRQIVQQDQEAHGYGYLPTTLWLPGELVTDYAVLPLPEGLAPGDYTLRVITYLRATGEGGGQADVPIRLTTPTRYDLQAHPDAAILCEAGGVALLGVELPEGIAEGRPLDFHAQWHAVITPTADLVATWTLVSPEDVLVTSATGPLVIGSRPATWPPQTWVRAPVRLDPPPTLPPGEYRLRVTLLGSEGGAVGDRPQPTECDLPYRLPLIPRPRVFAAPDLPHAQAAAFGDALRLLGYDWRGARSETGHSDKLTLTLWWQAVIAPDRDYKRFVHVYDPTTEAIVAQDDAMPRAWTYPTSLWAAGEVVSETVTLDLSAAPKGRYRVAVGWYDPETVIRLPARDAEGTPAPGDRIILETGLRTED